MTVTLAYVFELILKEDWFRLDVLVDLNSLFGSDWDEPVPDDGGLEEIIGRLLGGK